MTPQPKAPAPSTLRHLHSPPYTGRPCPSPQPATPAHWRRPVVARGGAASRPPPGPLCHALAPLAAVLLFLAAIVAAFWYLRLEEVEREQEALKRDVEYAQQRVRLRLLERQEQLMRVARDISNKEMDPAEFMEPRRGPGQPVPRAAGHHLDRRKPPHPRQPGRPACQQPLRWPAKCSSLGDTADTFGAGTRPAAAGVLAAHGQGDPRRCCNCTHP
jgi:hypothetical protein